VDIANSSSGGGSGGGSGSSSNSSGDNDDDDDDDDDEDDDGDGDGDDDDDYTRCTHKYTKHGSDYHSKFFFLFSFSFFEFCPLRDLGVSSLLFSSLSVFLAFLASSFTARNRCPPSWHVHLSRVAM